MKIKIKKNIDALPYHQHRMYIIEPEQLKAYNKLTRRAVLTERYKEALETLGVEFEQVN